MANESRKQVRRRRFRLLRWSTTPPIRVLWTGLTYTN